MVQIFTGEVAHARCVAAHTYVPSEQAAILETIDIVMPEQVPIAPAFAETGWLFTLINPDMGQDEVAATLAEKLPLARIKDVGWVPRSKVSPYIGSKLVADTIGAPIAVAVDASVDPARSDWAWPVHNYIPRLSATA